MALRVTIEDGTVQKRTINGKDGASFQVMSQTGILHCGKFVYPLNIRLNSEQVPYAPGTYNVSDESFGIDEYDNIGVRRGGLKLTSSLTDATRRPASSAT